MKQLSAILLGLLLVWTHLPASSMPDCAGQPAQACCDCGGKMSCCAPAAPNSQPAPAIPSNAGMQNQLLLPAPGLMVWALPENEAGSISSAFTLPLISSSAPLYERDCARLI